MEKFKPEFINRIFDKLDKFDDSDAKYLASVADRFWRRYKFHMRWCFKFPCAFRRDVGGTEMIHSYVEVAQLTYATVNKHDNQSYITLIFTNATDCVHHLTLTREAALQFVYLEYPISMFANEQKTFRELELVDESDDEPETLKAENKLMIL